MGARANLEASLGLLNTQYAGEFVFAGSRPDTPPVADAAGLLAEDAQQLLLMGWTAGRIGLIFCPRCSAPATTP